MLIAFSFSLFFCEGFDIWEPPVSARPGGRTSTKDAVNIKYEIKTKNSVGRREALSPPSNQFVSTVLVRLECQSAGWHCLPSNVSDVSCLAELGERPTCFYKVSVSPLRSFPTAHHRLNGVVDVPPPFKWCESRVLHNRNPYVGWIAACAWAKSSSWC